MVVIIQIGIEGSNIAMPTLPNEMAPASSEKDSAILPTDTVLPAAIRIYGSLISVLSEAPSTGSPETAGCSTVNCNTRN